MTEHLDPYDEAYRLHAYYQDLYREILQKGPDAAHNEQILLNSVKPGLYRHWESTEENPKEYAVFWVERGVDDGPFEMSYTALYLPRLGQHATRALLSPEGETDEQRRNGFLDPIDRAVYRGPRFTLIEEMKPEELMVLVRDYMSHENFGR
ncbi:MAG: hypothetical protein P4M11_00260 [Candidatus Pacebacteria bacterium]|nr:hypothetical protein [Candidatus Paceibacterota bacterium]